jgi:hypothetical protein
MASAIEASAYRLGGFHHPCRPRPVMRLFAYGEGALKGLTAP